MAYHRKYLTEEELLKELEKGLSDIETLNSDEESDKENFISSRRQVGDVEPDPYEIEEKIILDDDDHTTAETEIDPILVDNSEDSEVSDRYVVTDKKNIKWMSNVHFETMTMSQNFYQTIPEENELYPIDYFMRYIPDTLFQTFTECTNMYSLQQNDNNFSLTTIQEIKAFFGLNIITGCLKFPRLRMYWDRSLKVEIFPDTMTVNRYFKLRTNLHCTNNLETHDQSDRMWKVRPIFASVLNRCNELEIEQDVCVDEQMVPFKGKINIKQYVKGKPHPWGIKLFLLCGKSGLTYNFIIYQGQTTELNKDVLKKFGQGASVVLHLSQNLSPGKHKLFFDNFFTSYNLLEVLTQNSIRAAGTVRINRFASPPLPTDKEFNSKERGYAEEVISMDGVVLVKWQDNKPVILASNFVGIGKCDIAKRWDKVKKIHVEISRPEIIKEYNSAMGGVDKTDFLISLYRTRMRTRKWTVRMIFHAVDMAITNAWLEYKRDLSHKSSTTSKPMDLLHFRMRIGESLVKCGNIHNRTKKGRPSLCAKNSPTSRHKVEIRPLAEIQFDAVNHLPVHSEQPLPGRCKKIGCNGKSRWLCEKCKVHLCLQKDRNCFKLFHQK